jgi:hypothetical protein
MDKARVAEDASNDQAKKSLGTPTKFMIAIVIIAIVVVGINLEPHGRLHKWFSKDEIVAQNNQYISWANDLDAEAITGHPMPEGPLLVDVKSFDGIHTFSFLDFKSQELISVLFSDSKPDMTASEMNAAWNSYAKKIVAGHRGYGAVAKIRDLPPVQVVGHRQLKLLSGEIVGDQILAPLFNGGTAQGMQLLMTR